MLQVYTIKHDIIDVQSLMPGLILAIRKVVRLKVAHYLNLCEMIFPQVLLKTSFPLLLAEPCIWLGEVFVNAKDTPEIYSGTTILYKDRVLHGISSTN